MPRRSGARPPVVDLLLSSPPIPSICSCFRTRDQVSLSEATRAALESLVNTGYTSVGSAATDAVSAEVGDIAWQGFAWNRSCKAAFGARP